MTKKIYIVSYVSYDGYDNNLYTETKTFAERKEAEAFWYQSCKTARADARCEDESEYESDWKPIEENQPKEWQYDVWRTGQYYYTRVELTEQEIDIPYITDRRKYGMTLKEIRDEIAAFKDCSFTEATKKAEMFRQKCCVPLTWIVDFRLSFGKYSRTENGEVVYYGENRDTLHIEYTDREGDRHQFSIIE